MASSQSKVTQEWDAMAGEWDDMAGGYRDWFEKQLWEETGTTTEHRSDLVVVDFGCATGLLTEKLQSQVAQVVAIDVAPTMIKCLKDKIRAGDWKNVDAYCAVVGHLDSSNNAEAKVALDALTGKVDIVAASSVMNFVPEEDKEATMKVLGRLLKPGTGLFVHADWPKGDDSPDGITEEAAKSMYQKGALEARTTKVLSKVKAGSHEMEVFVGVATRPPE